MPFDVVADPERRLYDLFRVERSAKALLNRAVVPHLIAGYKLRPSGIPDSTPFGLPADFLIDPAGTIVDCSYGTHAGDSWGVDRLLQVVRRYRAAHPAAPAANGTVRA